MDYPASPLQRVKKQITSGLRTRRANEINRELDIVAKLAANVCECSGAAIILQQGEALSVESFVGLNPNDTNALCALIQPFLSASEMVRIPDLSKEPSASHSPLVKKAEAYRFCLTAPIIVDRRVAGHLVVFTRRVDQLSNVQIEAVRLLISQAASTLKTQSALRKLRNVERSLKQSQEEFLSFFEQSPIGMFLATLEGGFYHVNTAFCNIVGYSRGDLMNLRFQYITHPEDQEKDSEMLSKLFSAEKASFDLEKRFIHRSGRIVWVNLRGGLVRNQAGEPMHLISHIIDITEAREARIALINSEKQLQMIFQSQTEGLIVWDPAWRMIAVNKAAKEILGDAPTSTSTGPDPRWFSVGPEMDKLPGSTVPIWMVVQSGKSFRDYEQVFNRADGKAIWVSINTFTIQDDEGKLSHIVCSFSDISARKKLEEDLRQAQKIEVVGRLAGGIAHDFNNILTAMMLNLEEAQYHATNEDERAERLNDVALLTKQGARLTKQLLEFSRQQPMTLQPVEVNLWVSHVVSMIRRVVGDHISMKTTFLATDLWIEGDATMLDQVLMNLAINARDAMPKGGDLNLTIDRIEFDEKNFPKSPTSRSGSYAFISVKDTGTGMTPETLKRAFEPFFTTKEIGKGTGLGLASCHGVVHQHNGWIEVDSQVGAGTEFKIFLPTTTKRPVPEASSQGVEEVVGSETILFVEDQAILRRMVSKILTKHGYKVLTATDGVEAKQIWEAHQHDIQLLLSDVMMPNGYSGLDLARSFRSTHPSLKVILISGFSSTIREEIEAENIPFLAKPFTADDLCKLIEECLGKGSKLARDGKLDVVSRRASLPILTLELKSLLDCPIIGQAYGDTSTSLHGRGRTHAKFFPGC